MPRVLELERVGMFYCPPGTVPRAFRVPDGAELLEVMTGGTVFFGNPPSTYRRGTVFWQRGGDYTIHLNPPDDPYQCFVAQFRTEGPAGPEIPRVTRWEDWNALEALIDEALRRFPDRTVNTQYLGEYLYARFFWAAYNAARRASATRLPGAVLRAQEAVRDGFGGDLTVADLAAAAGVGAPTLHALFQKHLHTSPHRYLLDQRLLHARRRLAASDCPIKQLSAECGFDHVESFYRAFRASCGIPPLEYRRRQQQSRM